MYLDIDSNQQTAFEEGLKKEEEKALYCHSCDHCITFEKNKILIQDSHIHICINPQGIEYTIACFDDAQGCTKIGEEYHEYTWFEGYTWQISLCHDCGEHLGWLFRSDDYFYGLIKDRLVSH